MVLDFAGSLTELIIALGPLGIFLAMLIETVFPPIPSELVMPFGGYIAQTTNQGYAGLISMILAGTAGSSLGAVIIYLIALKGGRPLVLRYGKRLGINEKKIAAAESWFEKYGSYAVFLCRMIPGLRELISIPAGLAKMNFWKFLTLTVAGSFIWTAFLGSIGFFLADAWEGLQLERIFGLIAAVTVLSILTYFVARHFMKHKIRK
jgi:membrane protein DedA with SNARE-associated domain